jgi:hypothetical protein
VNAIWAPTLDSSGDGDNWTIILMIPASFRNESKYEGYYEVLKGLLPMGSRGSEFLMEPLKSSFRMLVSITAEVMARLLREWTAISDYIETFVASKFTFLDEGSTTFYYSMMTHFLALDSTSGLLRLLANSSASLIRHLIRGEK